MFIDPFHEIHGLDKLTKYFNKLYQNTAYCRFNFEKQFVNEQSAALFWSMELAHKSLKNGKQIELDGCTLIQSTDKVIYHRDYFDAGAMLYENIPIFSHAVKYIKGHL